MSAEYTTAYNRFKNVHRDQAADQTEKTEYREYTAEEFADIINKVIHLDGIEIDIVGTWVWLSGNTYPHRETIKAAGFFFSSKHKKWYYNGNTKKSRKHSRLTYEQVKDIHGCKTVKTAAQARLTA